MTVRGWGRPGGDPRLSATDECESRRSGAAGGTSAIAVSAGHAVELQQRGIEVLGRLIEVCSGEKYEEFVMRRILEPLGMKDTFFYPRADKVARIAMVYVQKGGKLARAGGGILGGDPAKYRQGAGSRPRIGPLFDRAGSVAAVQDRSGERVDFDSDDSAGRRRDGQFAERVSEHGGIGHGR